MIPPHPTLEDVARFGNLLGAYRRARRGKRDRVEVAAFDLDLERHLCELREEILGGAYRPGPYRTFLVHDPVLRRISAAPFRDRVVHQALCHWIEPVLESVFVPQSHACRVGKGTHRALSAASRGARHFPWVLHADVRKFFPSIDHAVLKALLKPLIEDGRVLDLCCTIIDASNPQEEVINYFPGDTLFAPCERRRGLPIGNLTSQLFANLMLHPLDAASCGDGYSERYIRYMDDVLLFGQDREELQAAARRMQRILDPLRLRLHPRKTWVRRTKDGFAFVGFRVFPDRRLLVPQRVALARRRMRRLAWRYGRSEVGLQDVRRSVRAWISHARHGDTYRLRTRIFRQLVFVRKAEPGP